MLELNTKMELLKTVINSNDVISCEQACVISDVLPERIKRDILMQTVGMIHMAESLMKSKSEH